MKSRNPSTDNQRRSLCSLLRSLMTSSALLLTGCMGIISYDNALLDRLKNRGPVPLSTSNQFIVANLFLNKEMEKSAELKGFLVRKGLPDLLSVEKQIFSAPTVILYYSNEGASYTLESTGDSWLIEGPNPYGSKKKSVLANNEPIQSDASPHKYSPVPASTPLESKIISAATNPPFEAVKPLGSSLTESKDDPPSNTPFSSPARALNSKRQLPTPQLAPADPLPRLRALVAQYGTQEAELSPKGDLVHYVTYAGESLKLLTKWYAMDDSLTHLVARINRIKDPKSLAVGDIVVFPKYLVKNKFRLTEAALDSLKKE